MRISFEKTFTVLCSAIIALQACMLLLDERFTWLFPYIFGLDLRYILSMGLAGFGAIYSVVQKLSNRRLNA